MNWRKSSRSATNGECVEAASWRKPARSMSNGHCAEVGRGPGVVGVRDSKDPDGPVLAFAAVSWAAFTARVKADS